MTSQKFVQASAQYQVMLTQSIMILSSSVSSFGLLAFISFFFQIFFLTFFLLIARVIHQVNFLQSPPFICFKSMCTYYLQ
jgi:hypothetical protein